MSHIQDEFANLIEEYLIRTAEFEEGLKKVETFRESYEFAEGLMLQSNKKEFAKFVKRLKDEGKYERFKRYIEVAEWQK
jgi:hypothetical protein